MTTRLSHWIDGRPAPGTSGRTSPVFNPATGAQTGAVELAGASAVASMSIMRDEGIVDHARSLGEDVIGPAMTKLAEKQALEVTDRYARS